MENFRVTYELFVELCYKLLAEVEKHRDEYKAILCPLRGGFFLSYFMSQHLNLPISYIEISSYAGKEQRRFQIGIKPELIEGKFLLCDDIYDSGNTIKKIHSMYPQVDFDTICLVSKVKDAGVTYGVLVEKDRWVDFFWEVM
ncbi:MAG TPA: phosphoribosyltransferase family protein [Spirochaetota bacterium]|nr:phosphoribosyltransferase family protein [Spirochaetota bacterium]HOK91698.1 phosphoribosyltransferase family protein [Spirochaetota bacterium]HRS61931.1 phosphoribosyltransferase family protein [Spirochaetota bacterium]HRU65604.1 phosphoribosyltransferase family protein [Spirochaetota bacterium]